MSPRTIAMPDRDERIDLGTVIINLYVCGLVAR